MLINQELNQKNGFLTPTMKIKRKKVYEKYKKDIEKSLFSLSKKYSGGSKTTEPEKNRVG